MVKTEIAVAVGVGVVGVAALPLIGFGAGGIAAASYAAAWQSSIGSVAAGSTFATLQSLGATGLGAKVLGATGAAVGGAERVAVGAVIGRIAGCFGLHALGFRAAGVAAKSFAALCHSAIKIANPGSCFSILQSLGATGTGKYIFGATGACLCAGIVLLIVL